MTCTGVSRGEECTCYKGGNMSGYMVGKCSQAQVGRRLKGAEGHSRYRRRGVQGNVLQEF